MSADTRVSDERLAELIAAQKPECCFLLYGHCETVACLKKDANGKRAAFPTELIGCEAMQQDAALRELRERRGVMEEAETYLQHKADCCVSLNMIEPCDCGLDPLLSRIRALVTP